HGDRRGALAPLPDPFRFSSCHAALALGGTHPLAAISKSRAWTQSSPQANTLPQHTTCLHRSTTRQDMTLPLHLERAGAMTPTAASTRSKGAALVGSHLLGAAIGAIAGAYMLDAPLWAAEVMLPMEVGPMVRLQHSHAPAAS